LSPARATPAPSTAVRATPAPSTAVRATPPPSTAVRQTADRLTAAIVGGELPPGSPLVEADLCAMIGVSRTTVREGLRLLVAEGLAVYRPHRGCAVASLSEADAIDIYRVRRLLETEGVRQAATVPTRTLEELAAAVEALDTAAAARDWLGSVEADMRFHGLLAGLLGSKRLDAVFAGMARELRLALSILDRRTLGPAAAAAEQRQILALLADGRRDECADLLERHLDDAAALLLGELRRRPLTSRPRRRTSTRRPSRTADTAGPAAPASAVSSRPDHGDAGRGVAQQGDDR
jgi:DNA-binding GntR family transcriptional regulator